MKFEEKKGFSLLELAVVMAIIIIISAISLPSAAKFISSQHLKEVAWQLVQDLNLAKENAVLYQQDLNIYINYNNTPVEPNKFTNKNNREYFFETFQWGKEQTVQVEDNHYLPTDAAIGHFTERLFKYNIVIDTITVGTNSSLTIGGKNYFGLCFRAGAGNTFRGEADVITAINSRTNAAFSLVNNNMLIIKLRDTQTNRTYYVTINGMGKVSMSGGLL